MIKSLPRATVIVGLVSVLSGCADVALPIPKTEAAVHTKCRDIAANYNQMGKENAANGIILSGLGLGALGAGASFGIYNEDSPKNSLKAGMVISGIATAGLFAWAAYAFNRGRAASSASSAAALATGMDEREARDGCNRAVAAFEASRSDDLQDLNAELRLVAKNQAPTVPVPSAPAASATPAPAASAAPAAPAGPSAPVAPAAVSAGFTPPPVPPKPIK